jgi:di/tricarboxylate transporter
MFTFDTIITLATFIATIIGLIYFQTRPAYVFLAAMMILYACDVVSSRQVIASASNEGLLTLMMLMMASLALEKTRLLRLAAQKIIRPGYYATWGRLFLITVSTSAFLNNSAVVATLLAPIRNNTHHAASKLLLPLSYAAILGGTITLVGTSTNLIVNSLAVDAGLPALGFFDFTQIGLALCLTCCVVLLLITSGLPDHRVEDNNVKHYLIDVKVQLHSKLISKSIEQNGLRHLESLFLVEILRASRLISPVSPDEIIEPHDRLIFSGDVAKITQLNQFDGLSLFAYENGLPLENMTEVVIRHDSVLVGRNLKQVGFRALFDAAVVAIKRDGGAVSGKLGDVILKSGDYLVLAVGKDFATRKNIAKNFIMISGVATDLALTGWREVLSVVGFFTAIILAACNLVPLFKSLLLLMAILIATHCLSASEVLQRLPKNIWAIIAGALLLSQALAETGVLTVLGHWLQGNWLQGPSLQGNGAGLSAFYFLVLSYVLTWWLTELVTNNAAAALMFPIALSFAESSGGDPQGFVLAVAFGASASFISPYGYQTNLMVFNAGHYRWRDFIRAGLPVSLTYTVTTLTMLYWMYF